MIPNIHQAIYERVTANPDCLEMGDWHCGTTHCRAGHVVDLAGEAGYALEAFYNTPLAAQLIYDASTPESFRINPGRFYDSNEDALADMKRLAESDPVLA
jgi:hypothetical protein